MEQEPGKRQGGKNLRVETKKGDDFKNKKCIFTIPLVMVTVNLESH